MQGIITNYLSKRLCELGSCESIDVPNMEDVVVRTLLTSRFRRKSINEALRGSIINTIQQRIADKKPINITFLQGCYKLWRLDVAPSADWAEMFALMHYIDWVKPILAAYEPGVEFDFFVDDYIMEKISNYTRQEIDFYRLTFQRIIDFIASYAHSNLSIKITSVSSLFESEEAFWKKLDEAIKAWIKPEEYKLDDSTSRMIDLNYRMREGELLHPHWKQELMCIHDAHSALAERRAYRDASGKILAMPSHYEGGENRLFLGSTKDSNVKYWVGVGALREHKDTFIETVLSPSQLNNTNWIWCNINLDGLNLSACDRIRIISK